MRGMSTPKLDDKFRLTLPAQFRAELTEEITVVCELDNCLAVYPRAVMDKMMEPINQASPTIRRVREYQRWMQYRAEDASPDKQGRITLTATQRAWAGLDRDVVVIGAGPRVEIWNPQRWETYSPTLDEKFENYDGNILEGV